MKAISVKTSPVPSGAYSQAVVANGLVFVAGVGPYDAETRAIVGTTIEEQTIKTIENIRAILIGAGCDLRDIVNSTVYFADLHRDWAAFDATYRFSDPQALSGQGDNWCRAEKHPCGDRRQWRSSPTELKRNVLSPLSFRCLALRQG